MSKNESESIKTEEKKPETVSRKISTGEQSNNDKIKLSGITVLIQKLNTCKMAIGGFIIFLLFLIIITVISLTGERERIVSNNDKKIYAQTSCGSVEGLMEDSSFTFRGIPYARQPVGELRFKYAQPLDRLDYCWNDTFVAHNDSGVCLQILGNGTIIGKEDCLTLDVVTPYVRYENPLPVIVLIGAESLIGGSPGKLRPSARYARSRDVVFVRPNFRLGALGFLALDILSESDYPKTSGNYGLSDILVALQWVQHNIEHFGGNKNAVTIFGHRAGATLVTALTTIKGVNKYFIRAWASSASALYPTKELKEAQIDNKSYLDAVRCEDIECLRRTDATVLVSAVEDTWRKPFLDLPTKDERPLERHQWLVLDGRILKQNPREIWDNNELSVNLIIGTTAHSGSSEKLLMKHQNWTQSLVKEHISHSILSKDDLSKYELTYKGLSKLISDIRIVCPLLNISSIINVPFYVVTQTRFKENIADIDSDVDAILGRYEPRTPEQRRYFSSMQGLFYHYVWDGNIEQNLIGQKVLIIDQDVLPNSKYSECQYWIQHNIVPTYASLD